MYVDFLEAEFVVKEPRNEFKKFVGKKRRKKKKQSV